ncbi:MAG TPA: Bax inhibitor-1/YccA family protein [Candidatus Paenalcaligenes intestinipullorum]|uniref:Bax inhibitor-1/YccA family protein n=1 Tax=Candidatus Paenalcaligenes intestinipullorum TaxID=2838718 RepID=A0A9D2RJ65_9BURK|nr:Bax inhibitor-1/YccA family protein [Candidatus Paenalcaligenes intestinipullorum]
MSDFNHSSLPEHSGSVGTRATLQNRVLRNTYLLLAISMVPSVLGAMVGLRMGVNNALMASPGLTAILFLAGAFGLMFLIERNKNSSLGVALLLAFTFFMGLMLSRLIGFVLNFSNGPQLIMLAFGGTGAVFATMATVASTAKRDFSSMSKFLLIGAIMLIVAALGNIFLQMPALTLTISVLAIGIFSAFLLVDLQRIIRGGETNYITATLSVYLSLYNIFSNLLMLFGIVGGDD